VLGVNSSRRIRVGIDVGGTFTKAVAIDMIEGNIIDKVTVPTTHSSNQGVSAGIVQALTVLMQKNTISAIPIGTTNLLAEINK
jgi:N-methylhydantoinase A